MRGVQRGFTLPPFPLRRPHVMAPGSSPRAPFFVRRARLNASFGSQAGALQRALRDAKTAMHRSPSTRAATITRIARTPRGFFGSPICCRPIIVSDLLHGAAFTRKSVAARSPSGTRAATVLTRTTSASSPTPSMSDLPRATPIPHSPSSQTRATTGTPRAGGPLPYSAQTFLGVPSSQASTLPNSMTARRSMASSVRNATWGVSTQFLAEASA